MIVSKVKKWLHPPRLESGDPYRICPTLYIVLLSAFVGAGVIAVSSYIFGDHRTAMIAALNVPIILCLIWQIRQGHLRAAGIITPLLFLATILYSMISGDGSHDTTVVIFPIAVLVASLLYQRQAFILYATLSILSITAIVWGELNGLLVNRMSVFTAYPDIIIVAAILFCIAAAIRLLTQSMVQTIHKLSRKEAALRESKARFQELAELMPETIFEIDLDSRMTFVNRNAFEQFGYTELDLAKGLKAMEMLVPEDRGRALNAITGKLHGGETGETEYTALRKDGTRFPIMIRSSRIIRDGQPVGLRGFLVDITERKKAENALMVSEARFRTIFEQAAVGIVFSDAEGKLLQVNQRFCSLLGYRSDELVGMNVRDITHPEEIESEIKAFDKLRSGDEKIYTAQKRYLHKNGQAIWAKIHSSVVSGPPDQPAYYVGMIEDITERKKTEADRKKLETQLQQAQKMEAIGTLAGGIAHDFNNILGSILGYSELAMLELPEKSLPHAHIDQVLKSTTRARDLVRQILAFSRQSEQELKPIRIYPIVKEAVKLLRATMPATIEIKLSDKSFNDTILSDPIKIHQVLMNLCTNAGHAMQQAGGILKVTLASTSVNRSTYIEHPHLRPGSYLKLSISDTGHGMPPETIERIFDPYFTTKQKGDGTGLGLSVVRGIVKSHRGAITVDSQVDQGTTFNVFLPCIQSKVEFAREPQRSLPRGREKILVVDDEVALADIAQQMLTRLGYDVVQRTSSIEALELFKADPQRFDLVFSDMTMPNMPGDEFARGILMIRPDIPIIICTGYSDRIRRESAGQMGISELVMKPLSLETLSHTVRKVLDASRTDHPN